MEKETLNILVIAVYILISFFVALESSFRGWKFSWSFFMCVVCTPLIGAVLFSHPNKKD